RSSACDRVAGNDNAVPPPPGTTIVDVEQQVDVVVCREGVAGIGAEYIVVVSANVGSVVAPESPAGSVAAEKSSRACRRCEAAPGSVRVVHVDELRAPLPAVLAGDRPDPRG